MIVVTGADGIVGRALCQSMRTLSMPFLPITHSRKQRTEENALVVELAEDALPLEPFDHNIKAIVHLAAAVPHSIHYPDDETSANKTRSIDRNILELQNYTNAHVVYMSTCGLYDRNLIAVKSECDQIKVTTPYFAAKLSGEEMFSVAGNATILRLAAPIGPGLKPNLVLSKFIAAARSNKPITIWGSGLREQNYIDTEDVGDLIIKALRAPIHDVLNVASETPTTMLSLAETVVSALGKGTIEMVKEVVPRDGEVARYSINKAKQTYGWAPTITLEQSIKKILSERFDDNV
jgi:nucleoside-diphosphate-sugar epimerase